MNHLENGEIALGAPNSPIRIVQENRIAVRQKKYPRAFILAPIGEEIYFRCVSENGGVGLNIHGWGDSIDEAWSNAAGSITENEKL